MFWVLFSRRLGDLRHGGESLVAGDLVEQLNPLQLAVVLPADFDFKAIQVALEGDRLIDFELAEEEWRNSGALVLSCAVQSLTLEALIFNPTGFFRFVPVLCCRPRCSGGYSLSGFWRMRAMEKKIPMTQSAAEDQQRRVHAEEKLRLGLWR